MSRIPVFVEKSLRKHWNKGGETCIFIAREPVRGSSEAEEDVENCSESEVGNNSSLAVSVVSCVKGVINSAAVKPNRSNRDRKSCIPVKESGIKNFGWSGQKLTPAKSVLTPAPVTKTRTRLKTKSKTSEVESATESLTISTATSVRGRLKAKTKNSESEGASTSQLLAPAKSALSPQWAFKSSVNSAIKSFSASKHATPASDTCTSVDHGNASKILTSFEYEDSEPECFQHEIRTRLESDSPASVKGLNKKLTSIPLGRNTQCRLNFSEAESKSIQHEVKTKLHDNSPVFCEELNKNSAKISCGKIKLQPRKRPLSNSRTCNEILSLNNEDNTNIDASKIEYKSTENLKADQKENSSTCNSNTQPGGAGALNNSSDDRNWSDNNQILDNPIKETGCIDCNTELQDKQKTQFIDGDVSGHITCVISSPPSTYRKQTKVQKRAEGSDVKIAHKSSKLPLFNKRSLPRTPSEIRTVKYGQKVIQESKDHEISKKSEGNKDVENKDRNPCWEVVKLSREIHAARGLY